MELTFEKLLLGKATKIKDKEYFSAKAYVTPFFEKMGKLTKTFIINVKPAEQVSLTPRGDINFEDIVYNRVWIQAILPGDYAHENHKRVVSMAYALDTRKPVVKFYTGALNMENMSLCAFDSGMLSVAELKPLTPINYSFLDNVQSMTDTIAPTLDTYKNTIFELEDIHKNLGIWIDRCICIKTTNISGTIKLAETTPIDVFKKLMQDSWPKTGFDVYNAFIELITKDEKDLINKFEKTLLVKEILNIQ